DRSTNSFLCPWLCISPSPPLRPSPSFPPGYPTKVSRYKKTAVAPSKHLGSATRLASNNIPSPLKCMNLSAQQLGQSILAELLCLFRSQPAKSRQKLQSVSLPLKF